MPRIGTLSDPCVEREAPFVDMVACTLSSERLFFIFSPQADAARIVTFVNSPHLHNQTRRKSLWEGTIQIELLPILTSSSIPFLLCLCISDKLMSGARVLFILTILYTMSLHHVKPFFLGNLTSVATIFTLENYNVNKASAHSHMKPLDQSYPPRSVRLSTVVCPFRFSFLFQEHHSIYVVSLYLSIVWVLKLFIFILPTPGNHFSRNRMEVIWFSQIFSCSRGHCQGIIPANHSTLSSFRVWSHCTRLLPWPNSAYRSSPIATHTVGSHSRKVSELRWYRNFRRFSHVYLSPSLLSLFHSSITISICSLLN